MKKLLILGIGVVALAAFAGIARADAPMKQEGRVWVDQNFVLAFSPNWSLTTMPGARFEYARSREGKAGMQFMEFFFGPPNVSHLGHLGGVLVGWVLFRSERRLPLLPSPRLLQHRWRRWRMRRQLHEVRREQKRAWRDQDRRLH